MSSPIRERTHQPVQIATNERTGALPDGRNSIANRRGVTKTAIRNGTPGVDFLETANLDERTDSRDESDEM
ncbi:hypothetical protein EA472_05440 [Natrarchaeobius oligotrophus]|uniref:Uncharacterized protein n=1 Tax=Natrarchaeobius chitinivorans TaxID=1679083 RepID=A0A3N6PQX6_NATCH|nr:hypothetical protein EA472_05440 [Natrarchaeobius chitinivorans]